MIVPTVSDADAHGGGSGGHGHGHVRGPGGARQAFPHSTAWRHRHAIGSHFATLGYDGVWLNTVLYTPTALAAQRQAADRPLRSSRAPVVKTPDPPQRGIIVVRGNSKGYVLFP